MCNLLYKMIMIPTGIGILGVMLFLDKQETWFYRSFGLLISVALSPFLLGVGAYLIVEETYEQFKSRKRMNTK